MEHLSICPSVFCAYFFSEMFLQIVQSFLLFLFSCWVSRVFCILRIIVTVLLNYIVPTIFLLVCDLCFCILYMQDIHPTSAARCPDFHKGHRAILWELILLSFISVYIKHFPLVPGCMAFNLVTPDPSMQRAQMSSPGVGKWYIVFCPLGIVTAVLFDSCLLEVL